jgi:ferredoxin
VDYSGLEEKIKDAANACPVQVIMYDETWSLFPLF